MKKPHHKIFPILDNLEVKPWYTRNWPDRTSVRTVLFSRLLICRQFFYSLVYINVYHFNYFQNLAPDHKKVPAPRENNPIPNPTIFWIPDQTVPRIKQNTAPWQSFFFGLHGLVQGSPMVQVAPLLFTLHNDLLTVAWHLCAAIQRVMILHCLTMSLET